MTLTSRSLRWVVMVQHEISDQYPQTCKVSTWSINIEIYRSLTQNFNQKFLRPWPWPQVDPGWVIMVQHKTSDQYLPTRKVSTWSIYMFKRLLKTLTENFNKKILSLWPWPQGHSGWVMMVLHKTSDQYLPTCKVSTWSINTFKRYRLLKTLMKKSLEHEI